MTIQPADSLVTTAGDLHSSTYWDPFAEYYDSKICCYVADDCARWDGYRVECSGLYCGSFNSCVYFPEDPSY